MLPAFAFISREHLRESKYNGPGHGQTIVNGSVLQHDRLYYASILFYLKHRHAQTHTTYSMYMPNIEVQTARPRFFVVFFKPSAT